MCLTDRSSWLYSLAKKKKKIMITLIIIVIVSINVADCSTFLESRVVTAAFICYIISSTGGSTCVGHFIVIHVCVAIYNYTTVWSPKTRPSYRDYVIFESFFVVFFQNSKFAISVLSVVVLDIGNALIFYKKVAVTPL